MAVRVAQGLVIASSVLLIIYGADEAAGRSDGGFLGLDAMTRGIAFGVPPIALSTAAFFISMRERSTLVSALLITNGVLIIIGGALAAKASIAEGASGGSGFGVLGAGIWVLALGIVKSIRSRALKTV